VTVPDAVRECIRPEGPSENLFAYERACSFLVSPFFPVHPQEYLEEAWNKVKRIDAACRIGILIIN
jgi:hypothetical protein